MDKVQNGNVRMEWDHTLDEILGDAKGVTGARLRSTKDQGTHDVDVAGVFIAIGHIPNSDLFKGQLDIDDEGYLITDKYLRTQLEGVWAAGEITDSVFRQAITSAGMGAATAIAAERWLSEQEDEPVPEAIAA